MSKLYPVITIDGFSATGKTTLAGHLSARLGWPILLSGMLYRYGAWRVQNVADESAFLSEELFAEMASLQFRQADTGEVLVLYDGKDIAPLLRAEQVSKQASSLAQNQDLRKRLLSVQRGFRSDKGLIAEGRDMASVVFPEAQLQVYLYADASVRAIRRYDQLQNDGFCANIQAVSQDIVSRDKKDEDRTIASLRDNEHSLVIDVSVKSELEVLAEVLGDPRLSAMRG